MSHVRPQLAALHRCRDAVRQKSAALPRRRDGCASKERGIASRRGRVCVKRARHCIEDGTVMRQESAALHRGRDGRASKERSVAPRTGRSCLKGARRCLEDGTVMRQKSAALPRGRDERASPAGNVATRHLGAWGVSSALMIGILLLESAGGTPAVPGATHCSPTCTGRRSAKRRRYKVQAVLRAPKLGAPGTTDNRQPTARRSRRSMRRRRAP